MPKLFEFCKRYVCFLFLSSIWLISRVFRFKVEFKHKNYEVVPGEVIAACFPPGFGSIQDIVKNLCYSGLLCFETSRKRKNTLDTLHIGCNVSTPS